MVQLSQMFILRMKTQIVSRLALLHLIVFRRLVRKMCIRDSDGSWCCRKMRMPITEVYDRYYDKLEEKMCIRDRASA